MKNEASYLFLLLVILFASCQEPQKGNSIDFVPSYDDQAKEEFVHELGAVRKTIEQSAFLYQRLSEKECPYNRSILIKTDNKGAPSSTQSLRFGMYGASFVYSAAYKQTQSASEYLQAILNLSQQLGIESAFDEEELKMLYNSNPEIDKSSILTKSYLRATEQMYNEERALLVSLMVLGGWIEGMSMSYDVCGQFLEDESIRLGLYDQTYSYYNCLRILRTFEDQESVKPMIEKMLSLEPLVDSIVKTRGQVDSTLFDKMRIEISLFRNEII